MTMDKKTEEEMLKKAYEPARLAMKYHPFYEGKIEVTAKCPVKSFQDFATGTLPASPSHARTSRPTLRVYDHTQGQHGGGRFDATGSSVWGDRAAEAGLPVMEGKARSSSTWEATPSHMLEHEDPEETSRPSNTWPSFGGSTSRTGEPEVL